jgi:hypothetical protein
MHQDWGEPQVNRSILKQPLTIRGKKFERGVGTHAASSYRLNLDGGTQRFEASVGLDDSANGKGSVVFRIVADEKTVFDSGVLRFKTPEKRVSVDLQGVKSLLLIVTDAGDGLEFDHCDWADARFTVSGAKPTPWLAPMLPMPSLNMPGHSAHRLAAPVRLPFQRMLPGPITDWVLMAVDGSGKKEYYLQFTPLGPEGYRYAQRRGRASNGMKPMWVLSNQRTGQGLALMLAYLGNWTFEVAAQGEKIAVRLATSAEKLKPYKKIDGLAIPGALVSDFTGPWDYGTQPMVRFIRDELSRDLGSEWPPVQYNTWYDLYDKIAQQRLIDAAGVAHGVGCELFTIDAGWFGEGLDARWSQTLGDWQVNRTRLPDGLEAVSAAVHQLGMKFGLWFEIECAVPTSRVAKEHPGWFLSGPDGVTGGMKTSHLWAIQNQPL